jgi:uncharacterized protein (UPF0333 family)
MKYKTKKGQVSLEYLMTYGIAIAIVVIAVAALYSMGVFSGTTTTVPPCSNCFNGDFAYNAYTYDSVGKDFSLELKNGPSDLENVYCNSTNAASCTVNSTIDANKLFIIQIVNVTSPEDRDCVITLTYTKSGSSLPITRTETISSDYFS